MPRRPYRQRSPLAQRFWAKVNKNGPTVRPELGPCWLWTGALKEGRYGAFNVGGRIDRAHRFAFFLEYGRWPMPCCLHKCDFTICVRFAHLYEGTQEDNVRDCWERGRADDHSAVIVAFAKQRRLNRFCVNGHEYTPKNTHIRVLSNGAYQRGCRACRYEAVKRWRKSLSR